MELCLWHWELLPLCAGQLLRGYPNHYHSEWPRAGPEFPREGHPDQDLGQGQLRLHPKASRQKPFQQVCHIIFFSLLLLFKDLQQRVIIDSMLERHCARCLRKYWKFTEKDKCKQTCSWTAGGWSPALTNRHKGHSSIMRTQVLWFPFWLR